jgi:hypothetical protein
LANSMTPAGTSANLENTISNSNQPNLKKLRV